MTFKNSNGMFLLGALFHDRAQDNISHEYVKFSLHDDRPGLINARRVFVQLEDSTGYLFAQRYLNGSYEHWTRLMGCKWFVEAYNEWMIELNAKIKQRSLKAIQETAENKNTPPTVRLQANKYLNSQDKVTHSRGRPSKEELVGELKRTARETMDVQEDMKRIGLKVV